MKENQSYINPNLPQRKALLVRDYYCRRQSNHEMDGDRVKYLRNMFFFLYKDFLKYGYLEEEFGDRYSYDFSKIGDKLAALTGREDVFPIEKKYKNYDEELLFTLIEFIFDYVSRPTDGSFHCDYWEYSKFDKKLGWEEWQIEINKILLFSTNKYSLNNRGQVDFVSNPVLNELMDTPVSINDKEVCSPLNEAIKKFKRRESSTQDRKDSVRDLAGVLEFLKPKMKDVLMSKDENSLFNIINNFGIRHNNESQKTSYDEEIYLEWMFHFFLATIHVVDKTIERDKTKKDKQIKNCVLAVSVRECSPQSCYTGRFS